MVVSVILLRVIIIRLRLIKTSYKGPISLRESFGEVKAMATNQQEITAEQQIEMKSVSKEPAWQSPTRQERLWDQVEVRASGVTVFFLTPFWGYSIFTPRCLVDVTPGTRRPKKELYERRQQQIGDKEIFLKIFFPLFPGLNNHSMGEGIFPEYNWNSWIPLSRCLKIR